MAIISYDDGSIRIVVHTGNLIESDWENRTQGLWISPKCPLSQNPVDSETGFKKDLIRYLEAYPVNELHPWIEKIKKTDMSAIR
jgi:tyrosyl-DNA phosphodiesterase 1